MKTVVCRLDLGMTRVAGYTLYSEITKEFQEITPKEVKDLITHGQVNGLKLIEGQIELDTECFNTRNLMVKSAVGKYRPMYNTDSIINSMYAVVRVIENDNDDGKVYEIVSNKCARVKVTPERLKMLMEIGYVAGVRLLNGQIEVCKGVTIEDKRTQVNKLKEIAQTAIVKSEQSLNGVSAETEQGLPIDDKNNLQSEQDIARINAELKTGESKENETIASVEKWHSSDAILGNGDTKTIPADTLIIHDNAEKNNKDNQQKEQVSEKKLAANRNTKKK